MKNVCKVALLIGFATAATSVAQESKIESQLIDSILKKRIEHPYIGPRKHRSLHMAPMIATQSLKVGLTRTEIRAFTSALRADPRWAIRGDEISEQATKSRNNLAREMFEKFVPKGKRSVANHAIVQSYFMDYRPDLAFDWMNREISEKQREVLQAIQPPKKFPMQLELDRMEVIIHTLSPHFDCDLAERVGKLFYFGSRLKKDLEISGDLEGLQMLMDVRIQKELGMTVDQLLECQAAMKAFKKSGAIPRQVDECAVDEDFGIGEFPGEDGLDKVRKDGLAKVKSILKPEQHKRFDELLCQRYMMFDESLSPLYLQKHFGEKYSDAWSAKIDRLPAEVLGVRQMRIVKYVKGEVEKIMDEDLTAMLGPPDARRTFGSMVKPKFDNPVAAKLMRIHKRKNPRRSR